MKDQQLAEIVRNMYTSPQPGADKWNPWGYENHVLVVAKHAQELAQKYNAQSGQVVAGALLHDIADTVMARKSPEHGAESLRIASASLKEAGFTDTESAFIVHEIIEPHSCNELMPTTLEGKVLATADAMAHFTTDFYTYFCWMHLGPGEYEPFKQWVVHKIEKDFTKKIFFDDEREAVRTKYEALKQIFSI